MKVYKFLLLIAFAMISALRANATDITGIWNAQFDSQIGQQKYTYTFKKENGKITGKAAYDHQMGKGENTLTDLKIDKSDISFVETVQDNNIDLRISYTGKISGDEMKLTRIVGEYGTEQIVAKRANEGILTQPKSAPSN